MKYSQNVLLVSAVALIVSQLSGCNDDSDGGGSAPVLMTRNGAYNPERLANPNGKPANWGEVEQQTIKELQASQIVVKARGCVVADPRSERGGKEGQSTVGVPPSLRYYDLYEVNAADVEAASRFGLQRFQESIDYKYTSLGCSALPYV